MSFVQLLGALSVDWMSPINQRGAWSKALLAKPNHLVATMSSSGKAMASALTPRLMRAPCVLVWRGNFQAGVVLDVDSLPTGG